MWRAPCILVITIFSLAGGGWYLYTREVRDPTWDLQPPGPNALAVTADRQMPGTYLVGSRIKDVQACGGFGPCRNSPRNLGRESWGNKGLISLVAFPDESVAYAKDLGIALRVINRSDDEVAFSACDSQLYLVQEALDANGAWRPIESLPQSWCGNSYHRVFLSPGQYWDCKARQYDGPIKTKIRFRLDPTGRDGKEPSIFSNEFEGRVTEIQFQPEPARNGRK